eukprot:Plantae.Rhodophyta-Rhodochaete_pulchella.ctg3032.p2 GENE.Plantae.Rhodophyta-Rhodochaete_pulchella.ctg3032~~Plantae.Rhodophyta-Rhodochaete_pulchella.ctg3032.p2  ORF type:complete len:234 (+),score=35.09 Plantae.Rhodophyta-Rhodochaete_pulchella.ctg3032:391-1092(+)
MGIFGCAASAQTLGYSGGNGNVGNPTDIQSFTADFGGQTGLARAAGADYHFSLVRTPIQASWGYQESFQGWYFSSTVTTDGTLGTRTVTPSAADNFGLVLNWVDISGNPDKYRWKLSTDEVWMDNSGAGYSMSDGILADTGVDSRTFRPLGRDSNKHAAVENYAFQVEDGVDSTRRECQDNVNEYYYIQFGQEGINDFNECSDRGLCNVETGECECFKGYKGTDCSIQSALAF